MGPTIGKFRSIPLAGSRLGALMPPLPETPLKQDLQKIDQKDVGPLHVMVGELRGAADAFVTFVHGERESGKSMGLETLASEIEFVSRDEHMGRFHSALGRARGKGGAVSLSTEGFSKMRRLEELLGNALGELNHRLGDPDPAPVETPPKTFSLLIPLIIFGVLGAVTVGIASLSSSKH